MRGLDYLAAAYTAIWIAIFLYLLAIGRRARRLEREIDELRRQEPRDR
ncbi:MAG TPA: CcmD family protein [Candidatus Binatia bacterium]|nr:CcmD family protein [Candidatus Binatia bacterium]